MLEGDALGVELWLVGLMVALALGAIAMVDSPRIGIRRGLWAAATVFLLLSVLWPIPSVRSQGLVSELAVFGALPVQVAVIAIFVLLILDFRLRGGWLPKNPWLRSFFRAEDSTQSRNAELVDGMRAISAPLQAQIDLLSQEIKRVAVQSEKIAALESDLGNIQRQPQSEDLRKAIVRENDRIRKLMTMARALVYLETERLMQYVFELLLAECPSYDQAEDISTAANLLKERKILIDAYIGKAAANLEDTGWARDLSIAISLAEAEQDNLLKTQGSSTFPTGVNAFLVRDYLIALAKLDAVVRLITRASKESSREVIGYLSRLREMLTVLDIERNN